MLSLFGGLAMRLGSGSELIQKKNKIKKIAVIGYHFKYESDSFLVSLIIASVGLLSLFSGKTKYQGWSSGELVWFHLRKYFPGPFLRNNVKSSCNSLK